MRILLVADCQARANYVLKQIHTENIEQVDRLTTSGVLLKDGTIIRAVSINNMEYQLLLYEIDQLFVTRTVNCKYPEYVSRAVSHVLCRSCVPDEFILTVLDE